MRRICGGRSMIRLRCDGNESIVRRKHDVAGVYTHRDSNRCWARENNLNKNHPAKDHKRIPSLDGIRAISICLVLGWHLQFFRHGRWLPSLWDYGTLGVFIFFVISGYIITRLLVAERQRTGDFSLFAFYWRRVFRILPPLLLFLIGVCLLTSWGLTDSSPRYIIRGITFSWNYFPGPFASLRHLWSLSVEEQFYILWPFLLKRLSDRGASKLLLAVIFIAPAVRLMYVLTGASGVALTWHFESVADGLAFGSLLGINQEKLHANRCYMRFCNSKCAVLGLPCVIVAAAWQGSPILYEALGKSLIFFSAALFLDASMQQYRSIPGRILNSLPFRYLGLWSYSLYLWQQVFLLEPRGTKPYAYFPWNLALVFLCSVGSYYLIEQPLIRYGRILLNRRVKLS
jgi:peptidoglycan/LPS O-acetylase OafA/YrhL